MCWFLFPNSNKSGANIQKNTKGDTRDIHKEQNQCNKNGAGEKDMGDTDDDDDDGIESMSVTPAAPLLPGRPVEDTR